MKKLTQIFLALLGVAALILTTLIAAGRLAWRAVRHWWKNRSKWFRCLWVATFVGLPVGLVALVAYAFYVDTYGRDYWDRTLSEHITLHSFSDNKWRVYNRMTDEYTTGKINWLSEVPENDSLAVYALPHRRGYINVNTGEIVIDAQNNNYRKAWVFSEGLGAVMQDNKVGFVNAKNEVVIPFQFDYSDQCRMYDFAYAFHHGYCAMTNADGYLGLIDRAGNWVVEPAYDYIGSPEENGYRLVNKGGRFGILDSLASVVYPADYDDIDIVPNGFVLTQGGRKWEVDCAGNVLQPFLFDATYYLNYPDGYNECGEISYVFADYVKYEVRNHCGIMNRITGKPLTPAIYSDIHLLSKELFEVQELDSYDWYLLDTKGNVVKE